MQSGRGQRKYMEKVEKPSKVLLVCIYDTVVLNLTNEIIRSKFQTFGKITNILIFEKGQVTKLFVQFQQVSQASKAKNRLDGTKLCDSICKMTIYYSNFSNVEVSAQSNQINNQNNTDQNFNRDEDIKNMSGRENFNQLSLKRPENLQCFLDDDYIMQSFNPFSSIKRSKTQDINMLKKQINQIPSTLYETHTNFYQNQARFSKNLNLIQQNNWLNNYRVQDDKQLKIKQQSNVQSSILWFPYRYQLKPKQVYNLFSNFGNISCITIKKQNTYVKFRTKQFAAMANTYLNNTILIGNVLLIRECPEDSQNWKSIQGQFSESVYYNNAYDRFTPQRSITINPPANTIHVSSLKKQLCRQKNLRDIFSKYGDIERIKILENSAQKSMALIKYYSIQDAFSAVANIHNEVYQGRKIQISFTKSKI